MRRRTTLLAIGSLLAGLAAAVALTTAPAAQAWDIHALPAGYSVEHDTSTSSVCPDSYVVFGYGATSRRSAPPSSRSSRTAAAARRP
jgi:hypothetical protein